MKSTPQIQGPSARGGHGSGRGAGPPHRAPQRPGDQGGRRGRLGEVREVCAGAGGVLNSDNIILVRIAFSNNFCNKCDYFQVFCGFGVVFLRLLAASAAICKEFSNRQQNGSWRSKAAARRVARSRSVEISTASV